jgi:hypothetical protein
LQQIGCFSETRCKKAVYPEDVKIQVECHAGYKADERPIKFWLGETVLFVEAVEDQWYGPDDTYFRLRADDGNTYVLCHKQQSDTWTLESFRSHESAGTFDPHLDPPDQIQ